MPTASVLTSATAAKRAHPERSRRALVITIDGPAGAGKSTAARLLAKRLGLSYLDTGATYRALAYAALEDGVDVRDPASLVRVSRRLALTLRTTPSGPLRVRLDGVDVTRRIRTERVTDAAAILAQHSSVRRALVRLQRRLARGLCVVAEGRDTGTVVFPHATYKFFLTADSLVRARRRQRELRSVQGRAPSLRVLAGQLEFRDGLDRRRRVGPLAKPRGAVVVETSHLTARAVVDRLLRCLSTL